MRISTQLISQIGTHGILSQQASLSQIQAKIASGKKILSPADDPSGSAQIVRLAQAQSQTEQFQRNSLHAINRLTLEETVLHSVGNSLQRIRELAIQANNSTLDAVDRQAIGREVRERLNEIFGLANTRDANGEFLFSGYQVSRKPFSRLADGTYYYNADQGQRQIQISPERRIADGDSGYRVFMDIRGGNGSFEVLDNKTNSGSGIADLGMITDPSAYVADTYTITFITNGSGRLGYNVTGAAAGQVIPPLPLDPATDAPDFVNAASIRFNGIETKITGAPAAGDTYTIRPAGKRDVFSIIDDLASSLENSVAGNGQVTRVLNTITRSIQDIDNVLESLIKFRTNVGARLAAIETQTAVNEAYLIEMQATAAEIRELDLISAISELQRRTYALEAAQASFIRIQGLSVFNFL